MGFDYLSCTGHKFGSQHYIGCLITACNSGSRGSDASGLLRTFTHASILTYRHTTKKKKSGFDREKLSYVRVRMTQWELATQS